MFTCLFFYSLTESWVHYNDAHITLCSLNDVLAAQAYILFYEMDSPDAQVEERVDDDVTFNYIPKKNKVPPVLQHNCQPNLKRQKSTLW